VTSDVIWHDLECGAYVEDLPLWRALAEERGDPILEIGAGTGRVALDLARHGHRVTALELDPALLAELERRARSLQVHPVLADARDFSLPTRFSLLLVPMQTVQLLGGGAGRRPFFARVRDHLRAGGLAAIAIIDTLEPFDEEELVAVPLPDICELEGIVYSSQPTAVRADADGFVLERRREAISAAGERVVEANAIRLDRLAPAELEAEARAAGLKAAGRLRVPATADYAGSIVVLLGTADG
jgi:SAM-dependent methyltransferase